MGGFAEGAVSFIVKQGAGGEAGDIQVLKPVIVNIGTGHTHSVEGHLGHAGALGDVLEPAIAEIAVKGISDGLLTLASWGFTAVDEEDIQPSVVVIVQKGDTAAGGFNEKAILGLAVEMAPGDAGLPGDVGEKFRGGFLGRFSPLAPRAPRGGQEESCGDKGQK